MYVSRVTYAPVPMESLTRILAPNQKLKHGVSGLPPCFRRQRRVVRLHKSLAKRPRPWLELLVGQRHVHTTFHNVLNST